MEKFVVKQLWLSGKGKKMFRSGDVVTAANFPENFETLIREGRIEKVSDSKPEKPTPVVESESKMETALDALTNAMGEPLFLIGDRKVFTIEDLNKKELVARLEALGIQHDPKDKKDILWGVLMAS